MEKVSEIFLINARLKKGDDTAFLEIYERHHQHLYIFVYRYIQDNNLIDDILHDAFLKLWEARARISLRFPIHQYLFRITRNLVFQELKSKARTLSLIAEISRESSELDLFSAADFKYQEKEYEEIYQKAVDSLPPQRQRVFILCREKGASYKEAAQILDISPQTVKEHMALALKSIRNYLGAYQDIVFLFIFLSL